MKKVILFLVLPALLGCGGGEQSADDLMQILAMKGNVSVNQLTASTGQKIKEGDIVDTGGLSTVDIQIGPGDIIRVRAGTSFSFVEARKTIELKKGGITSLIGAISKNRSFQVKTPVGVVGVRGTTFHVQVSGENEVYSCSCNGSIEIRDKKGEVMKPVSADHHKAFNYSIENGEFKWKTAGMENHTDQEIKELGDKVGFDVQWLSGYL